MALAIATNNAALNAAASASSVNRDMETSMARLSTGKRINSASDDAAGVAISSRLSAEIRGTDQAIRNSLDGQALIDTAEGAHKEIENILQRMREVSVQAANDTNNSQDRSNLQAEMDAMVTEIDRIAGTTTWAGANLMEDQDGTEFSFQVGAATGDKNQIDITIDSMGSKALGVEGSTAAEIQTRATAISTYEALETAVTTTAATAAAAPGAVTTATTQLATDTTALGVAAAGADAATGLHLASETANTAKTEFAALIATQDGAGTNAEKAAAALALQAELGTNFVVDGNGPDGNNIASAAALEAIVAGLATTENSARVSAATTAATAVTDAAAQLTADTTALGTAAVDGGAAATGLHLAISETTALAATAVSNLAAATDPGAALSENGLVVDGPENARKSIDTIDDAIKTVNVQRSELGAVSNRLNHTVNNLTNISSNLSAAKGGIEDADFALETTNLAKNQILQQASTAMLAQANASKQNVLSLLQG